MKNILFIFSLLLLLINYNGIMAQTEDSDIELEQLKSDVAKLKLESDSYRTGKSKFLLRGYAHSGLQSTKDKLSFVGGGFNPLFIYKQSDKLLFESELEFELDEGEVNLGLEYANMSYLLTKSITLRAGKFLVPFGIFVPNLHPAWVNKFPGGPLGAGHEGILPTNDIGLELRGGSYLKNLKINYSFYIVNGSQLNNGAEEADEGGIVHHAIFPDNNKGKTYGSRIGFFPFSNSSMEIGISGMYGKVGTSETDLKEIAALHYAFDLSYVKSIPALSSVIDMKAQYSAVNVDKADYFDRDSPTGKISFDNKSTTWFAQMSIRPALLDNNFIRNLEFAARYSTLKTPEGSNWAVDNTQLDFGINYWVDWRTLVKFSYRISKGADEEAGHVEDVAGNAFFIHWAIGF